MANIKVSQLPAASTPLTGTELAMVVQGGVSKQTAVSTFGAAVAYTPAGTGAVATTAQSKLRERISVYDFMTSAQIANAVAGLGTIDVSAAIQNALDQSPIGAEIVLPPGTYGISTTVSFNKVGQSLIGLGYAGSDAGNSFYGSPTLKWNGAANATMVKVVNGSGWAALRNISFNANSLAGTCLFVEALNGSATHNPALSRLSFVGYTQYALILGENNSTTLKNGQMDNVVATDLQWHGGKAGAGATGVLINAQNLETLQANAWFMAPDVGREHYNHIKIVSGNVELIGFLTPRATNYCIDTNDNIQVYNWRAEDRYLLKTASSGTEHQTTLSNVAQRYDASYSSSDQTVLLQSGSPVTINGLTLIGSLVVAPTTAKYLSMLNVVFPYGGTITYQGPPNNHVFHHDTSTGVITSSGSAPGFVGRGTDMGSEPLCELTRRLVTRYVSLPTGATPDVTIGSVLATANTGVTTVTKFTNLLPGQHLILFGNDAGKTTISNASAFIRLTSGAGALTLADGDTIQFIGDLNGTALELCRSKK